MKRLDDSDPIAARVRDCEVHEIGRLRYRLAPAATYLLVHYDGQVGNLDTAQTWFAHLEAVLQERGLTQILWDSRDAEGHPPPVRARIWEWLEEARVLKRSAIVVHSDLLRLSANLSGVGGKIRIKAFPDFETAALWLG